MLLSQEEKDQNWHLWLLINCEIEMTCSGKQIKFKKRDRNRHRKQYPYLRRKPKFEYVSDNDATFEVGAVSFSNTDSGTYNFQSTYTSVPVVTAVSVDSEGNNGADVNIYVSAISTSSVTFSSSASFTGEVHFHIFAC